MAQQLSQINVRLTANNVDYIKKLIAAQNQTKMSTDKMGKDYDKLNKSVKGAAQGIGWQIQDIAVQAQMGTDNLIILAQQGPQILSLLGPMGALAGAGLAVAAALGMAAKSSEEAKGAVNTLEGAQKSLNDVFVDGKSSIGGYTDEIYRLYEVDRELAELKLMTSIGHAETIVSESKKQIRGLTDEINDLGDGFRVVNSLQDEFDEDVADMATKYGITSEEVLKLNSAMQKMNLGAGSDELVETFRSISTTSKTANGAFKTLALKVAETGVEIGEAELKIASLNNVLENGFLPASTKSITETDKLITKYRAMAIELGQTEQEQDEFNFLLNESVGLTAKQVDASLAAIRAYHKSKNAIDAEKKSMEERAAVAKSVDKEIKAWNTKAETVSMNERQQAIYNSTIGKGLVLTKAQTRVLTDSINTYYDHKDATEASKKSLEARQKAVQASIKLDQEQAAARAKRLADIQQQATKMADSLKTPEQLENEQHKQNSETLATELLNTKKWEYSERARINLLIEQEQQRHTASMTSIAQQQVASDLNNMSWFLGSMGDITSKIASMSEENEGLARAMFLVNQTIAFANAIVNTELAASKALAYAENMTLPQALASQTAVRAMGYASAGIIAGTTIGGLSSGQYHAGTDYVPDSMNDQSFLLKAGERVVQPKANADLTEFLNQAKSGQTQGSTTISAPIYVTGNVTDEAWFAQQLTKQRNVIAASYDKVKKERPRRR